MRKRTNLIRVFEDDKNWIDNDVKKFLSNFNYDKKKLTRAESIRGMRNILEGSSIFFPDNMFANKKKKKFSLEYKRGKFKL